jgi:hypothetical protein
MGIIEVAKTNHGGHNPWFRRAVCEQHKYGSVRGAPRDGGSYSISRGAVHAKCRGGHSIGANAIAYTGRASIALSQPLQQILKRKNAQLHIVASSAL